MKKLNNYKSLVLENILNILYFYILKTFYLNMKKFFIYALLYLFIFFIFYIYYFQRCYIYEKQISNLIKKIDQLNSNIEVIKYKIVEESSFNNINNLKLRSLNKNDMYIL